MIHRNIHLIQRIIFLLFIAAGTMRLSAQARTSDVGIWIVDSELEETSFTDEGDEITFDFDEEVGFGISFNHFWTERFSTELAVQKFSADMTIGVSGRAVNFVSDIGSMDLTSVTAMGQLHFRRATRFAPYVGAGLARTWGDFDPVEFDDEPTDEEAFDLEANTTWTAAVGANVRITDNIYFVGEMKYIPWEAIAEEDPDEEPIDLNPVTFAAGVKVRF
jgi:outer membrane protein W